MKLYNSIGPNPQLVRIFIQEKGLDIELAAVDLLGGENRQDVYKAKNPAGQLPCLELDDGSFISETLAICEYLEDVAPEPPLVGSSPQERAETRMWTRRVEFKVTIPLADGFRFAEGLPLFKDRIRTIPQAADDLKTLAREGLEWFDDQLAGKTWIVGERFTLADIVLYSFLAFGTTVVQPYDPTLKNIAAWYARVEERPSVAAAG